MFVSLIRFLCSFMLFVYYEILPFYFNYMIFPSYNYICYLLYRTYLKTKQNLASKLKFTHTGKEIIWNYEILWSSKRSRSLRLEDRFANRTHLQIKGQDFQTIAHSNSYLFIICHTLLCICTVLRSNRNYYDGFIWYRVYFWSVFIK